MKKHLIVYKLMMICTCLLFNKSGIANEQAEEFYLGNSVFVNFWHNPAYTGEEKVHNINAGFSGFSLGAPKPISQEYFLAYDFSIGDQKRFGLGFVYAHARNHMMRANLTEITFSGEAKIRHNVGLRIGIGFSPFINHISEIQDDEVFVSQVYFSSGSNNFEAFPNHYEQHTKHETKFVGVLSGGLWLSHKKVLAGASFSGLHTKDFINSFSEDGNYDYSTVLVRSILGYHFIINDFRVIPALSFSYRYKHGIGLSPLISFTYKNHYIAGIFTEGNADIIGIMAGANFAGNYRVILSAMRYTNHFLHEATGIAQLNCLFRVQF